MVRVRVGETMFWSGTLKSGWFTTGTEAAAMGVRRPLTHPKELHWAWFPVWFSGTKDLWREWLGVAAKVTCSVGCGKLVCSGTCGANEIPFKGIQGSHRDGPLITENFIFHHSGLGHGVLINIAWQLGSM